TQSVAMYADSPMVKAGKMMCPNDGEGELQPGNEERIELHEINPRTSASSPIVKLTRREWLTGAAGTRPRALQGHRSARDRDVPSPSCNRPRRSTWPRTRPPFRACRYRCERGSRRRTARR